MLLPHPLFAVEVGQVIGVIVMVLAILGWLGNLVGNKNQPPPAAGGRPQPPPRPRDKRLQSEIDVFLQEVTGKKKPPADVPIEIVPEEQRRPRQPVRPAASEARKPASRSAQRQSAEPRQRASGVAAQRSPGSGDLGTGVASHVKTFMAEHQSDPLGKNRLQPTIGKPLLDESDGGTAETSGATLAQQVVALVREPGGVQRALVLNEILMRPKALRDR